MEFLTARLNEDERVARLATQEQARSIRSCGLSEPGDPASWSHGTDEDDSGHYRRAVFAGDDAVTVADQFDPELDTGTPEHIARHDPARVLADVAAKRALLRVIHRTEDDTAMYWGAEWSATGSALRYLAQPYADHPDFDPAWKVEM